MVQFRTGSVEDLDAVIALFDANVSWLVAQGRADQWGSEPFSENPKLVEFARELLSSGTVTIAEIDGDVVGASVATDHPMACMCQRSTNRSVYLELVDRVSGASRGADRTPVDRAGAGTYGFRGDRAAARRLLGWGRSSFGGVLRRRRLCAGAGDRGPSGGFGAGLRVALPAVTSIQFHHCQGSDREHSSMDAAPPRGSTGSRSSLGSSPMPRKLRSWRERS